MNKKEASNQKEVKNQNYEAKKMNTSRSLRNKKDQPLPWWVEILFVQIGLPDTLLVNILKAKRRSKDFIKNDKKSLMIFLFIVLTFSYFYPVVKHSKNKLDCESIAKDYITKNKNISQINNKKIVGMSKSELKMLSTNFCNGGEEIYEIKNLKN